MKIRDNTAHKGRKYELPMLAVRELVLFPKIVNPLYVTETANIRAVDQAMGDKKQLFLAYRKNTKNTTPGQEKSFRSEDLHDVGTVAQIMQILRLPDNTVRLLLEGKNRAQLVKSSEKKGVNYAQIKEIPPDNITNRRNWALMETLKQSFKTFSSQSNKKVPKEIIAQVDRTESPDHLVGQVANALKLAPENKVTILSQTDNYRRLEELAIFLQSEIEIMGIQKDIHGKVRKKIEDTQKEYYLNEQLKQIRKELGTQEEDATGAGELQAKLDSLHLPREVREKGEKEIKRLSRLQPMSPESGVLRTYLEWLTDLPWGKSTPDHQNIDDAAAILDHDHYDMKKPKERILDFIAVRQLETNSKGPILCLVGPPGTGKTSLGKSVARALGREFVRISLGGVRDEAEIRGHRKTYVGALPGKIIQSMKKAGSSNPVFLLDEIDKMNSDFRGDPAAAMLEVLDPEQNTTFVDHYLEVPFDLSQVMFITTANSAHTIPRPLLDRMELIEVPGYTEVEKRHIARDFILPKQRSLNGLTRDTAITFTDEALKEIIEHYTMESGVRNLERQIGQIMRKIARRVLKNRREGTQRELHWASWFHQGPAWTPRRLHWTAVTVDKAFVDQSLGKELFRENDMSPDSPAGLARGLAWTEAGGRVLPVEVTILPGKGELILTGSLGDVMKESCRIALSYIKSRYTEWGLEEEAFDKKDIHIHVPEGAIPKDGPSAGITMTAAILSAARQISLKPGFTMTGEITLTDRLLPIGGVKEKVLASHRNGLDRVILPERNRKDAEELPPLIRDSIDFSFFSSVKEAIKALFPEDSFPD